MARHQLSLEFPETNNEKIFRVTDTSTYTSQMSVKCATLHITSPGFSTAVAIDVLKNFNLILNACTLGLTTSGCEDYLPKLPDGVYHIRYSVSPNDKVYVEYYHLRISQINNTWNEELDKIDLAACEPDREVKERLDRLYMIRNFIDAAKVRVEYRHDCGSGMKLLLYAQEQLDRIVNGCATC